ncbi:iron-siderophore ABC transporter substrate-binding protein [Halovulum dunhuangense]|uniref:Iron-siderophore ABC transporter substrate-binding protein n=1 Tax=Halovulum dunhuangense TaxID=1505036 RepID=A0A849L7A1_9RHOB|nr:iron-siderophore ABC transporter substrate-binding protein [Halovulum dunhuangense]NNU82143.1 iron-siderophore ABC transporter substrate-binding protein [Halovulum dunhuangense]
MLRILAFLAAFTTGASAQSLSDSRGLVALDAPPERIVALSWALAELLVELDVTPVGVADVEGYGTWVVQPALPEGVADMGLRNEPNLEQIAAVAPDLILASDQQSDVVPMLERIAPVAHFESFTAEHDNAAASRETYLALARMLGKEAEAEARLADLDARIAAAGERVATHFGGDVPPVLPIRLLSPTNLRLHGANSMAAAALSQMGLDHAAPGEPTDWGFVQRPVEDLAEFDSELVLAIEPFPQRDELFGTQLWQFMPFVRTGRFAEVRPVWTFGGVFSLGYIAEAFAESLMTIDPEAAR